MLLHPPRTIPNLKKAPRLQEGDTVMIIAPASPPSSDDIIHRATQRLEESGFRVQIGSYARERNGFLAGLDSQRLSDLSEALSSPSIKAIFCLRGGYGSGRIMHAAPFNELTKYPKIFVGSSDLTGVLYGCALDGNLLCFHGPTLESLVDQSCSEFTWDKMIQIITGHSDSIGSILKGYQPTKPIESLNAGVASGRLIGGNLSVLLSLLGTRFFPSLEDSILFLEDVGETPFRIDRFLTQLLNLGALQRVRGFALGLFERCEYRGPDAAQKQTLKDVVIDRLAPLGKPIVLGLPFGHTADNATIPVGGLATLDANRGDLILEELSVD
ncbi:MAG: LD-carboxypeptidase [Pseudomonadota bacterium]